MSDSLTSALAKFHKDVGTIHKNSKAQYGTFASLADVLSAIASPLSEAGLAVTQTFIPTEGGTLLRTTLRHSSGETVDSDVPLIEVKGRNALHDWGGAVTYQRRFSLLAILNLAAGVEDDDGDSADAKPPIQQTKPQARPAVKTSPTPAQSKPAPAKAEASAAKEPVEPPLPKEERDEIIQVLTALAKDDPDAFAALNQTYRTHFKVSDRVKTSDHIQEQRHGDFIQRLLANPPAA
ncbi:MAG: ERF family protein [Vulcanococcus sp.]